MNAQQTNIIAKGATIIIIGALIGKFLSFLYRIVVSRLGEFAYGELSIAIALFGMLNVIALLGLETGLTKFISTYLLEHNKQKIKGSIIYSTTLTALTSITLAITLWITAPLIATSFFHTPSLAILIKIFAITLPFESLRAVIIAIFNAHQVVKYDVYWRVLFENAAKILLAILAIILGYGVVGAALAYLFSILLSYCIFVTILIKKLPYLLDRNVQKIVEAKPLLLYSLPLVFNTLAIFLLGWMDSLMLGYLQDPAAVGIYNVAVPASRLLLIIPTALTTIYIPAVITLRNNPEAFLNLYQRTTKWIFISTIIISAWIILYARELITFFFTENYIAATIPLIILTIGFFFFGLAHTSRDILLSYDRSLIVSLAVILGAVLNIVLNYLLIPAYGVVGAALASAIVYIGISVAYYFVTYITTKKHAYTKNTLLLILIAFLSAGITYGITTIIPLTNPLFLMILGGIILTLLIGAGLLLTQQIDNEDREILQNILQRIRLYLPKKP